MKNGKKYNNIIKEEEEEDGNTSSQRWKIPVDMVMLV